MKEGDIKRIIHTFFKNNFSAKTVERFFYWLRIDSDREGKDRAMQELWDRTPSVVTDKTRADYARLHARIETATRIPVVRTRPLRSLVRYAALFALLIATGISTYFITVSVKDGEAGREIYAGCRAGPSGTQGV